MRYFTRIAALVAVIGSTVSCGDVVRQGKSPAYLIIDSIVGIAGRSGTTGAPPNSILLSDVLGSATSPAPCSSTTPCPTVFNDMGRVTFRLALKDQALTQPTTNNAITINRYHIRYRRSDGRNVQGVDVPYEWDGAITVTVPASGTVEHGFELVRHVAKQESPLVQLVYNSSIITTIAEITFYGRDQVGNEVVVTGSIQVDFGNFGDA